MPPNDSLPEIGNCSLERQVRACLQVLPILRAQLDGAVDQVETAVVEVCRRFGTIAEGVRQAPDGQGLEQELGRVVVLMQFQDAVSQRVRHVIETLRNIEATFAAELDREAGQLEVACPWIEEVVSRHALQAPCGAENTPSNPTLHSTLHDDVELF